MTSRYLFFAAAIAALLPAGCIGQTSVEYGNQIEVYQALVGMSETDVKNAVGSSRIEQDRISLHDPETYEPGLSMLVSDERVFLRMTHGLVAGIVFRSPHFKTERGISVGQTYCDVLSEYPDSTFTFGFEDGGFLRLTDEKSGLEFEFAVAELPLEKYIIDGLPAKTTRSLCDAVLERIDLAKRL